MLPLHLLDDDTVEALLTGRPVTPGLAPLAGAVGELRAVARQPVRPSAELAQRLASGDFSGISPAPPATKPAPAPHRLRSWLAAISPRARIVTGAVLVFTGLSAATAAGALPGGAQHRVESFVEAVTPISFQRDEPDVVDVEDAREPASDRGRPDSTTEPAQPGSSPDPGSPVTPAPGKPETPPGRPDSPGNSPETPPGQSDRPARPPGKPEAPPGQADRPAKPDKPQKPDHPGSPGQGGGSSEDRPTGPDR
jgi:hypothetical protein